MTKPPLAPAAEVPTPVPTPPRPHALVGGTLAVLAVVAAAAVMLSAESPEEVTQADEGLQQPSASECDLPCEDNCDSLSADAPSSPLRQRVEAVEANHLPDFLIDERAMSVGKPNAGRLIDGVQLPASPAYIRRTPRTMWGSGQTIASLQQAIASFRRETDYDGELILGDISVRDGGPLHPHTSHQAGRDVDLWLPTLQGVFKPEHLGRHAQEPRRPMLEEVDWRATWGLLRALLNTGAVERVFLERRCQELVVQAALQTGSTAEELDAWFQWPRSPSSVHGVVRHSAAHQSHLHVRFKCADWERDCGASETAVASLR